VRYKTRVKSTRRNRPSKCKKAQKIDPRKLVAAAKALAAEGYNDCEVAPLLGIGLRTLYRYKTICPDFARALQGGQELSQASRARFVEHKLYQRALGYSHPAEKVMQVKGRIVRVAVEEIYPPDVEAQKVFLKGNMPSKYRERIEHSSDPEQPVRFIIDGLEPVKPKDSASHDAKAHAGVPGPAASTASRK